jgi:Dyp-type peroxidase family
MPATNLPEWADMQGLVLSAYPHLDCAAYLLFRIDDSADTRRWLSWIADHVTTAFERVGDANVGAIRRLDLDIELNVNIALSYTGLSKLHDVADNERDTFAYAFWERIDGGIHRSRILGDTGPNDPRGWDWGGHGNPVDLLLMVFAQDGPALAQAIAHARIPASMVRVVPQLDALSLKEAGRKEHFGFTDGMSQPILRGTADAERYPDSIHLTEVGEFVLGYPDGENTRAQVPVLGGCNQFGKNGTYLVFRQLQQHVGRFWNFLDWKTSSGGHTNREAAEQLAAKIVGRQKDGTPLVPYGSRDDNEFDFRDDRHGYGCPIGAHIRRAHPRGSLSPDPSPPPGANRHRLLRRGRPYGAKLADPYHDDGKDRGLLFVCLNSDFERQFEFINQNWVNNPGFSGLMHERDPMVGAVESGGCDRFTIPGLPARTRVEGLPSFVTVRGGEYFFLPGIQALRYLAGAPIAQSIVGKLDAGAHQAAAVPDVVSTLERQVQQDYGPPRVKRDAHPKMHGCVQAELFVDPKIPLDLQHGVFVKPAKPDACYKAWIRFSNAFRIQHDLEFETRGMGIKLLDVPGPKLSDDEAGTQDFLLATHDAFFLPDGTDYDKFAEAVGADPPNPFPFFKQRGLWLAFYRLLRGSLVLARNPLDIQYYSQTPYQLGPHEVKLQARPRRTKKLRDSLPAAWWFWCQAIGANLKLLWNERSDKKPAAEDFCHRYIAHRDLLRLAMMSFLAEHDAWFDLLVQTRTDPDRMPIDDATIRWCESASEFKKVATIRIPRQAFWPQPGLSEEFRKATTEIMELGENMSFNPWHALPEHRPLGSINDLRRIVYPAIVKLRHRLNRVAPREPAVADYDRLKEIVR